MNITDLQGAQGRTWIPLGRSTFAAAAAAAAAAAPTSTPTTGP